MHRAEISPLERTTRIVDYDLPYPATISSMHEKTSCEDYKNEQGDQQVFHVLCETVVDDRCRNSHVWYKHQEHQSESKNMYRSPTAKNKRLNRCHRIAEKIVTLHRELRLK